MSHDQTAPPRPLEKFREYLHLKARLQLGEGLIGDQDASDLVQRTLLAAHEHAAQFRGTTAGEQAAWLRSILANQIAEVGRRVGRHPSTTTSINAMLDQSSVRLLRSLRGGDPSPETEAQKHEDMARLEGALQELSPDQREAVELHHLYEQPISDVAILMGRSNQAVVGLIYRGLQNLRSLMLDSA
ncbi:sigma-70 family RNA polymerase sigma factor [Aquisphaera insulae]|uniref:sigma-70 family RNA polymerase sigma factor n=1 Tax=Aquisphaera insulae TaxID=2712864 RepID=UPI0013EE150B|nr:sigma-70 family RNA polymerase sigma factor [Aquisphaera insulae]